MQVVDTMAESNPYRSLARSFSTVLRNEGIRGLYRGVVPATVAAAGSWGGFFYFYEYSKARKLQYYADGDGNLGVDDHVILNLLF
jgi:solute carrier family 25 folate transporter 32